MIMEHERYVMVDELALIGDEYKSGVIFVGTFTAYIFTLIILALTAWVYF